jgi:HD-GYP domain-containing protein (c-di-GMP phosphodiesterase class II)
MPIGDVEEPEVPIREQLLVFAKELSHLYREERERSLELENAYEQLSETYAATIKTLAFVVEAKDLGTRRHLDRTHVYGLELARSIDSDLIKDPEVGFGFLLHDIGKVGIPESILGKPGPLTDDEWQVMRTHPVLGAQIVQPMRFLGEAIEIIRCHHERFDGKGYPGGMKGAEIPLAARIFAVVDSFDAMTSDRPYRSALSIERAMGELDRGRETQFDPEVVDMFVELVERRPWTVDRAHARSSSSGPT